MSNLYLIDADNNRYDFPEDFWIQEFPYRNTTNVINIAFAHGGRDTADGFLESRNITVSGALRADTLAELETKERAFHKAILNGGKLYVSDDTVTRYLEVTAADVPYAYIGDYRLEKPVDVLFIVTYPFWQSDTLNSQIEIVSDGDSFTIDNSASDVFSYPVITIEADQGADLPSIYLRNNGDGGMIFEYKDSNFAIGDILEIDSRKGTVKRNGNNSIENLTQARFLRLQNHASNTLYYEGDDCTITVDWREVYL